MYNLTTLQNSVGFVDLVSYANESSAYTLTGGLMIAVFFVSLLLMIRWGFDNALLTSGFICFVLSGFLTYADVLSIYFTLVFLAITAFTGLWVYTTKRN